jgi:hypothetical protein
LSAVKATRDGRSGSMIVPLRLGVDISEPCVRSFQCELELTRKRGG